MRSLPARQYAVGAASKVVLEKCDAKAVRCDSIGLGVPGALVYPVQTGVPVSGQGHVRGRVLLKVFWPLKVAPVEEGAVRVLVRPLTAAEATSAQSR